MATYNHIACMYVPFEVRAYHLEFARTISDAVQPWEAQTGHGKPYCLQLTIFCHILTEKEKISIPARLWFWAPYNVQVSTNVSAFFCDACASLSVKLQVRLSGLWSLKQIFEL